MPVSISGSGTISGVPGSVLQVVQGTTQSITTITNSATLTDSGLTATITPKSSNSKVLVMVSQPLNMYRGTTTSDDGAFRIAVLRGSTIIFDSSENRLFLSVFASVANPSTSHIFAWNYLDSPSTASAITYKTQGATAPIAGTSLYMNCWSTNTAQLSTLILMEVAS